MSILRFAAVRREIGTFVIVDDVSAAIAQGDRIGLVGVNGAGKTTLLRLAAGRDEPDAGKVVPRRGLSIGLLAQEANFDAAFMAAETIRLAVRAGAVEVERMEVELAAMEAAGAEAVAAPAYAALRERFEARDGYHLDLRVDEALSGLGFARAEWHKPPSALSGGEQTRAALARLVVSDPDLILLDEPTNHLDIGGIEWLEQALVRRGRALLVASHDRAFLDAVANRIWELRDRRLATFRGGYSAYLLQRESADARASKEAESARDAIERERELVQRYRSHRKYTKMHEHERRLEAFQDRRLEAPRRAAKLALSHSGLIGGGPVRSGDLVVGLRDALVGLPVTPERPSGIPVARIQRLEAQRGDRIGIVGPNGAGKTTLLRTIAGELAPLAGRVRLGASVVPAYLAQVRDGSIPGATVLDALLAQVNLDNGPARAYLARFLFRGEDVFKPVAELSGGERSRLELALLGITPANLLLLDEPTNHLDIPAREALESFLRGSPATLLVVSHDRRLLQTICDRLWVVEVGQAGAPAAAAAFEGGHRAWRAAIADGWTVAGELELQSRRLDGARVPVGVGNPGDREVERDRSVARPERPSSHSWPRSVAGDGGSAASRSQVTQVTRAGRPAALSKDAYRRQKAIVEGDLTRLGLRKSHLELALGDPGIQANYIELRRISSELADVDAALAQAEEAWLVLEERAPR
jgi:ATP-binding cassette subfamily F protein 3